jgi:hypothetical protein
LAAGRKRRKLAGFRWTILWTIFKISPNDGLCPAGFDYAHRDCPGVRTCNPNGQPKLIDHVFYRGSLRARPILPGAIDEQTSLPAPEQPSDHLPLVVEFS